MKFSANWFLCSMWLLILLPSLNIQAAQTNKISRQVDLQDVKLIKIINHSGVIKLRSTQQAMVKIEGTLDLDAKELTTQIKDHVLIVEVKLKPHKTPNPGSQLVIIVPQNINLFLKGVHSNWNIENLNSLRLESLDGNITIKNVVGDVNIEKVDGDLSVESVQGDISIHTITGKVSIKNTHGKIKVEAVNSDIDVSQNKLVDVTLENTYGNITIAGIVAVKGKVTVNNVKGIIRLLLGDSPSVLYHLQAPNNKQRNKMTPTHLIEDSLKINDVVVGAGEGKVNVITRHGEIRFNSK